MPQATDAQVQQYANERVRVRAEQLRAVLIGLMDDRAAIDDVYARLVEGAPWSDARTDGPPKLLDGNDVLAFNAFAAALLTYLEADANWPTVRAACVRPPL
jgi:hypothetical protein